MLDGALALALPTKPGQLLDVSEGKGNAIKWTSLDADGSTWYRDSLTFDAIINKTQTGSTERNTLIAILHEAANANPEILSTAEGFNVVTRLTFPRQWGLGTSSTLINNIAQWFNIDAYALLEKSFGGSGYDIACAQNDTAVLYRRDPDLTATVVHPIKFNPGFTASLYFIYLNQKQNSREAIAAYRNKNIPPTLIETVTSITNETINATDADAFALLMEQHEQLMGPILEMLPVKERLFPDFKGTLKSLGAWGGDFILAVCNENPGHYFRERGYNVVIPYNDMIL